MNILNAIAIHFTMLNIGNVILCVFSHNKKLENM